MKLLSPFFWICTIVFVFNQFLEKGGVIIPFIHSYLDDLLCPGIVLGFVLFVQQQFTYRNADYTIPLGQLIFFVFWYSLLFEVVFPAWDNRHYADVFDILAYGAGTILFMIFGNRSTRILLLQKPISLK